MKKYIFLCLSALVLIFSSQADVNTDNVVIVLDASGSMGEPMGNIRKMDAAKDAIATVLKTVPQSTHIGLLVFSGSNKVESWVYPLGVRDDTDLLAKLRKIHPRGGTPLGKFIKIGADRLLKEKQAQLSYGTFRLLIVTDGQANDKGLVRKYTPDVLSRGIIMDVIGVKMNKAHELAKVAHSYRSADDPASLTKAIADVLAEVSTASKGAAHDDAFALLDPIPDGVALIMVQALAVANTKPISAVNKNLLHAKSDHQHSPAAKVKSSSSKSFFKDNIMAGIGIFIFLAIVIRKFIFRKR